MKLTIEIPDELISTVHEYNHAHVENAEEQIDLVVTCRKAIETALEK